LKAIVFLGPGRCGTTSIDKAFRQHDRYVLFPEKETNCLSKTFDHYREEFSQLCQQESRVFVDCSPLNLIYHVEVIKNLLELDLENVVFVLIRRPVSQRIYSLYRHHVAAHKLDISFQKYFERSREVYQTWRDSGAFRPEDETYGGLVESAWRQMPALRQQSIEIIDFSSLFEGLNSVLSQLGWPEVGKVHTNKGYVPRLQFVDSSLRELYKRFGLGGTRSLDSLKILYKRINSVSQSNPCKQFQSDFEFFERLQAI
jgi:hypothetical protein